MKNRLKYSSTKVPAHLKPLYDKHKQIYGQEVDGVLQTFGQTLKTIHSNQMAALLCDVHSATVPTSFTAAAPGEGRLNVAVQGEGASNATTSTGVDGDVVGSKAGEDHSTGDNGSKLEHDETSKDEESEPIFPNSGAPLSPIPSQSVGPADVSIGQSTYEKKTRHKRCAKKLDTAPKLKRIKMNEVDDIYKKYILHKCINTKPNKNEEPRPFVQIGGYFVSYEKFQTSLKPRGEMSNEVMYIYTEMFNMEAQLLKHGCKKFAFSQIIIGQLIVDPIKFKTSTCLNEFQKVWDMYNLAKADLLLFPIVRNKHWILCCINLLHKNINIFDSIKSSDESIVRDATNNLVTNFVAIATEASALKLDISSFKCVTPIEYPQQDNQFDCGFLTMLYMENWTGKNMNMFGQDTIKDYRKCIAARLISHPSNSADSSWVLKEKK